MTKEKIVFGFFFKIILVFEYLALSSLNTKNYMILKQLNRKCVIRRTICLWYLKLKLQGWAVRWVAWQPASVLGFE